MICATSSSPPLGGAAASWPLPTPGHMANWTSVFRRRASRLLPVISFTMHHGFFEGLPRVDRPSTRRDQPALVGQAPTVAGPALRRLDKEGGRGTENPRAETSLSAL
jgi:hypothetical protein